MFNVARYDPKAEHLASRKKKKKTKKKEGKKSSLRNDGEQERGVKSKPKKRKLEHRNLETDTQPKDESAGQEPLPSADTGKKQPSAMHVIADQPIDESGATDRKLGSNLADEAFDDLDIIDEVIEDKVDGTSSIQVAREEESTTKEFHHKDVSRPSPGEIRDAVHMSNMSLNEAAIAWDLAPFLVNNLKQEGFEHFFPIQSLVIPNFISSEKHGHIRAQDICVTAPTGSGKTLAFVLPILNALSKRQVKRLRALVVLPSRDLAQQVYDVFQTYTNGSDIKIGLAIGKSDFLVEQASLIIDESDRFSRNSIDSARYKRLFYPCDLRLAVDSFSTSNAWNTNDTKSGNMDHDLIIPRGGKSAVDVLVCTPGRLVDHLDNTPGFTLQHLRFLVLDEADRLLSQSYHDWLGRVIDGANSASVAAWHKMMSKTNPTYCVPRLSEKTDGCSFVIEPITWRRGGVAGDGSDFSTNDSFFSHGTAVSSACRPVQLRKLLYSATLTRDPRKLTALGLVNPKHFDARSMTSAAGVAQDNRKTYLIPSSLLEYTIECTAEQKPIVLLAVLLDQMSQHTSNDKKGIIVVFTSSLESTHRLTRLLQLLWVNAGYGEIDSIAEFSGALKQKERSVLVKRCADRDDFLSVVVCSDGMSRGMDIELVTMVINYDVPSLAKTYVHRCGRTARAGKEGTAVSLLKGGQVSQFKKMRRLIDSSERVRSMGVKKNLVRNVIPVYRSCVRKLGDIIQMEENGELNCTDALPDKFIGKREG